MSLLLFCASILIPCHLQVIIKHNSLHRRLNMAASFYFAYSLSGVGMFLSRGLLCVNHSGYFIKHKVIQVGACKHLSNLYKTGRWSSTRCELNTGITWMRYLSLIGRHFQTNSNAISSLYFYGNEVLCALVYFLCLISVCFSSVV